MRAVGRITVMARRQWHPNAGSAVTLVKKLEDVRTVACSRCQAQPGEFCKGARPTRNGKPWHRETAHVERLDAWCRANAITPAVLRAMVEGLPCPDARQ